MTLKAYSNVQYYFLCFLLYSFIGYAFEVLLELSRGHGFINRGFNFGPWLPVYGFGGILILVVFYKLKDKVHPIAILGLTSAFAATVELLTTYILDLTGVGFRLLWEYDDNFLNFQGRIALWPALRFGIIAVIVLYIIQPRVDNVLRNDSKLTKLLVAGLLVVFTVDAAYHIVNGSNFSE